MDIDASQLRFFAVRSTKCPNGQWYGRQRWTNNIKEAKLYTAIGGARNRVTFFAQDPVQFGVPEIVEFSVHVLKTHNEEERVKKQVEKRANEQKKRLALHAKMDYDRAVQRLETDQAEVERLRKLVKD